MIPNFEKIVEALCSDTNVTPDEIYHQLAEIPQVKRKVLGDVMMTISIDGETMHKKTLASLYKTAQLFQSESITVTNGEVAIALDFEENPF